MATAPDIIAPAKNKRLSDRDRDNLIRFARQQIADTQDTAELDVAYDNAADAIHAAVLKLFPAKDMKVLAQYDCAAPDTCIYVSTGGNNYDRFEFRNGDKRIPVRPSLRGCRRQAILLTGDAEDAYDAFKAKADAAEERQDQRLYDFRALIRGTINFNALAKAWPAAEQMRERIVGTGTALAVLSSEVIDRLRADPAFAKAA